LANAETLNISLTNTIIVLKITILFLDRVVLILLAQMLWQYGPHISFNNNLFLFLQYNISHHGHQKSKKIMTQYNTELVLNLI